MGSGTGIRVGRYEVVAEIGHGAMGVVYQARDPRIDRTVALKTISLNSQNSDGQDSGQISAEEKEYRERFVLEAKAVGRLSHPGIVTIFDAGEDPDTLEPYIAMEFVQGQSLQAILGRRSEKISLHAAMQIAREIAEALDYAHSQGVIHRDIKPANILVTPDGHVKIADFGIAKLNQAQATLPGEVLGSPAYMAPEQLKGDGVDPRSDLFSAGVILYNMLTGFRPFQGDSATTICYKVVNRNPIYVSAFDATFPPELDRIVAKAIAKNPDERFQTGQEFADAIAEFQDKEAGRQNSDFLKEVIEEHNLVPVFRELSVAQAEAATLTSPAKQSWKQQFWPWALMGTVPLTAAIALFLFWQSKTPNVPAIVFSQTIPAPKLEVPTLALAALHGSSPVKTAANAQLDIELQHQFSAGVFSLWLDHKLICERELHSEAKRHALFFKKLEAESIDLTVPAGEHHIEIRVQSAPTHYDQQKKIIESFDSSKKNVLHVYCDRDKNSLEIEL
jgi:serine/threonine protein kinase